MAVTPDKDSITLLMGFYLPCNAASPSIKEGELQVIYPLNQERSAGETPAIRQAYNNEVYVFMPLIYSILPSVTKKAG